MKYFFKIFILLIVINIKCFAQEPLEKITVLTFNIENGGTQVSFNKVVEAIQKSGADIVGIQEAWGNIPRLAQALHWQFYDVKHHLLAKFPLFEVEQSDGYALVEIKPHRFIAMANLHLPDEPYGPDRIKAGDDQNIVRAIEEKTRLSYALPIIQHLNVLTRLHMPVFITGDFNSPSHEDWTAVSVNKVRNHRYAMVWPVTDTLAKNGFRDAYRSTHPDYLQFSGLTWPAFRPLVKNTSDGFNPSKSDLADRIDFIFTNPHALILDSKIMGEAAQKNVDIPVTPWPSDHRAVLATFSVQAIPLPNVLHILKQAHAESNLQKPEIIVTPEQLMKGQAFKISWKNAPAHGYDYVTIYKMNNTHLAWGEIVRLYTKAKPAGSIEYNAKNVKGNQQQWNICDNCSWPLLSGTYVVKLMLDDGDKTLAMTKINIKEK